MKSSWNRSATKSLSSDVNIKEREEKFNKIKIMPYVNSHSLTINIYEELPIDTRPYIDTLSAS